MDIAFSFATLYLAYLLRFNFDIPETFIGNFFRFYLVLILLKIGCIYYFRLYQVAWRFFTLAEAKRLIFAHFTAYFLFTLLFLVFSDWFNPLPRSAIVIDFVLSLLVLGGYRVSKRIWIESSFKSSTKKAIIVGVNPKSINLIKSYHSGDIPFRPVLLVDDDPKTLHTYFLNMKVQPLQELETLASASGANAAIIAKALEPSELDRLFERLNALGINEIKIAKLLGEREERLQDIAIEDLLARKPKDLDQQAIHAFVADKVIMITGAGGSIGSELCRQMLRYGAKRLILVDNSEYNLYALVEELGLSRTSPALASVMNLGQMERLFRQYRPDIVLHAAAYKHVPMCEMNIRSAIENNVLGTKRVIDLAIAHKVPKVVLISTDKAVRPTSVMGATKRICELYAQNVPTEMTQVVAVRFGNVLGSSGSVIPKFKNQIEHGGPITVTHREMTRYFMLIPEACQLVLQAAAIAENRQIHVLDMGEPMRIVDLAEKMRKLYNKEDIDIVFTGLRPGEKLYEELLIDKNDRPTRYRSIFIGKTSYADFEALQKQIETLLQSDRPLERLQTIVPEFNHQTHTAS